VEQVSGAPAFAVSVTLTPPDGQVTDFKLHYDVIIEQLVTHQALVSVRTDFRRGILAKADAEPLGVFDWNHHTLTVPASGGSWMRGMVASARLGLEHVSSGSDHLLFLLMLLLPAPLVAAGGRWRRGWSGGRSAGRVEHVVSAFAVGHSTTLVLAGLGVIHAPSRPIEALIAASIAVSALPPGCSSAHRSRARTRLRPSPRGPSGTRSRSPAASPSLPWPHARPRLGAQSRRPSDPQQNRRLPMKDKPLIGGTLAVAAVSAVVACGGTNSVSPPSRALPPPRRAPRPPALDRRPRRRRSIEHR
jgi:hypothetical protein